MIPKITALAITLNEENTISAFLESLHFVDEIIIIDSYSKDNTQKIAQQFNNVIFYQRAFDNFSSQKNFAISKASHPWILFFDPDEKITQAVKNEILETLKNPKAEAYFFRRQLYFMGKKIKYSGFQTDWVVRLFKKECGKYNGNLVHETIEINGNTQKLKTRVPHYTYKGFEDYTQKLNKYSQLQAKMLLQKNKKPTLFHFFFRPTYRFWHQYILRLGILDGKEGFILAYINASSVFKRYVYLYLFQNNKM